MKGFLKRDWYLLRPNLCFYAVFLVFFLVVFFFSQKAASFFPLYLLAFGSSSVVALFNYDESDGWYGYAAALPGGRRVMVDARYGSGLVMVLTLAAASALSEMAGGSRPDVGIMSVYGSAALLAVAVSIPLAYRFGGLRARLASMLLFFGLAGGITAMALKGTRDGLSTALWHSESIGLPAVLSSLALFALSWRLSRNIVMKKEF